MASSICDCLSCSKFRNWDKIDFLKRKEIDSRTRAANRSLIKKAKLIRPFDCVPDEVLIQILECISPNNINDFITLISLEMVSWRFRNSMVKANEKIWKNTTELVLGIHPNLPDTQYLCHIGHYSLIPFLRRVPKITKIFINFADNWLCPQMLEKRLYPAVKCFAEKFELHQLTVDKMEVQRSLGNEEGFGFLNDLVNGAKQSLKTYQFSIGGRKYYRPLLNIAQKIALMDCQHLKNVRVSIGNMDFEWMYLSLGIGSIVSVLHSWKDVELLEINGYSETFLSSFVPSEHNGDDDINAILNFNPISLFSTLRTLRFTNPKVKSSHCLCMWILQQVQKLLSSPHTHSIEEFEIHLCTHSDDLSALPNLLENAHLTYLKITFHPHFLFTNTAKIIELLENTQLKNKEIMISITFLHSEVDYDAKLAIIRHLLDEFDVTHTAEQENVWVFIRGKVCINLKLEKMQDPSIICHPDPPEN